MTCTKRITITGFLVRYVDLREPKPRAINEEVYTLDKDGAGALGLLGLNAADFITARYEHGGYHVIGVEQIRPRRTGRIDLCQLWEQLAPAATEEAPATNVKEEDTAE
ncbi:MAG: hypothetical protein PUB93_03075 [Firmicutes bacterium]|nr:hypothetical protein [Bacillota bacterium]